MSARLTFSGPVRYRLRGMAQLSRSILEVSARRMLKGPRRPGWNWFAEVADQDAEAAGKHGHENIRCKRVAPLLEFGDDQVAGVIGSKYPTHRSSEIQGRLVLRQERRATATVVLLHGGGYSFYPRAYAGFIAQVTLTAKSRTFALDYRLTPEHRFPAQLEDALHCYRWLIESGINPETLVLCGDSAGGNLALALVLAARDSNLPLPSLAVALSPPSCVWICDVFPNQEANWITKTALLSWRDWFCDSAQRHDPLVSPLRADLRGLPPIYIRLGAARFCTTAFGHLPIMPAIKAQMFSSKAGKT